jgi:HflK protein
MGAAVMSEPADRASRRRLRRLRRRGWAVRWRAFGRWLVRPLVKLAAALRAAAAYLAAASERSLTRLLNALRRNRLLQFLFGRGLRRSVFILAGFAALIALIVQNVFIVGVADNAVIIRLGRLERIVDPGLGFKFPFLEQKYMVATQVRLQENFGFIQYTPPPQPKTEREVSKLEHELEVATSFLEGHADNRESGLVTEQLQRTPLLPRDYMATLDPAPVEQLDPQAETEEVIERIEMAQEALENIIPPDGKLPVPGDMKMMTGDLNIVYVTWSVQYEIVDPRAYLFRAADVRQVLRDLSMVAMRTAVGDRLDSEILSRGRNRIAAAAKRFTQEKIDAYQLGLEVKELIILDANPPDEVQGAFHMVNQAKQEMEREINKAQSEYNSVVPHSHGRAARLLSEARAYALELGNRSQGEAARFDAILKAYRAAPEVTRDRYYIEAMEDLYARTSVTLIDTDVKGILPLFEGRGGQMPGGVPTQIAASEMRAAERVVGAPVEPFGEPIEQPMRLPQSTAVRNLPWEPQPAPDLPPPPAMEAPAASTAQGVQGSIRDVAPLGAAAEAPPSGGRPAPAGPRGPVGSGAPAP